MEPSLRIIDELIITFDSIEQIKDQHSKDESKSTPTPESSLFLDDLQSDYHCENINQCNAVARWLAW